MAQMLHPAPDFDIELGQGEGAFAPEPITLAQAQPGLLCALASGAKTGRTRAISRPSGSAGRP